MWRTRFGARRYIATFRVAPVTASGEAFVEWSAEFDADAAEEKRLTDFFADGRRVVDQLRGSTGSRSPEPVVVAILVNER